MRHSWRDPHIICSIKCLLRALYITLGVFLFFFVSFHIGGALYTSHISTKSFHAFETGIARDLAYLKEQGDEIAKDDSLQKYLLDRDSQKLIELTKKEISERGIGLMGVADENGILLSRTLSQGNLGNNIFLVNPVGRVVAQGKSAQSVEATVGFDPKQIFLNTGRPIMRDGRMIGALTANYLTDNAYAVRFRDAYLSRGVEVVFYNKNGGVFGNSFSDKEIRNLISSYFNSSSDWIKNGSSGKTISFKDGSFYLVENFIFPGLEQSPGGALIFIPRMDVSNIANIVTTLFILCVFIFLALRHHFKSKAVHGEEHGWRYYALLMFISIPVAALSLFTLHLENLGYLKLERIPYTLYNSTLRLQPEFGVYSMGFEQHFSIVVDTGDEDINAVEIGLLFDPDAIEVKSLDTANSSCSYVIENKIDSAAGKANLSCVILKSNGERGSLPIADVFIVPKRIGAFTLSFDKKDTKVLASDGLGTDVLRMSQSGSYQVNDFDPSLFATDSNSVAGKSFVVFSPTHPNRSRWYNSDTARFVWIGKPDDVYKYEFDNFPDTIPSNSRTVQDSTVTIPVTGDGIFYFHLQLASGGPIAHYRIQADHTPPSINAMHLSSKRIIAGDVVRFSFEAQDLGSGVQQNYYVDLGNHLFLPTGSQLFIPFLEAGDQTVVLRVYDSADNYAEKSQIIHVDQKN